MEPSRIQAVDHVNIEALPGLEDELRWFYTELAQLAEVAAPATDPPCIRFRSEQIELRVHLVPEPQVDPVACRVTITVPSLDEAAGRLDERSISYERLSGLAYTDRRLQALDPAGNRVEFKQAWREAGI